VATSFQARGDPILLRAVPFIGKGILKKLLGIIDDLLKAFWAHLAAVEPSPKSKPAAELRKLRRRAKSL
jgi:hypothetical protein